MSQTDISIAPTLVPDVSDETPNPASRALLLDCPVDCLSLEGTVAIVDKMIRSRRPHRHCAVNAAKLVKMHRDPALQDIVRGSSLISADGMSVVWTLRLLGYQVPERVTGIDLMFRLLEKGKGRQYRVYLLGATEEVLNVSKQAIQDAYPGVVIVGARNGYFAESENDRVVHEISKSGADLLFVAISSPKKEKWLATNVGRLNVPFCMGVGGSFDILAGKTKRAPHWFQDHGLEWLYRFIQEPVRMFRRYWIDSFVYIYLVLRWSMRRGRSA